MTNKTHKFAAVQNGVHRSRKYSSTPRFQQPVHPSIPAKPWEFGPPDSLKLQEQRVRPNRSTFRGFFRAWGTRVALGRRSADQQPGEQRLAGKQARLPLASVSEEAGERRSRESKEASEKQGNLEIGRLRGRRTGSSLLPLALDQDWSGSLSLSPGC